MAKPVHIDQLRAHLSIAQQQLALEKAEILKLNTFATPLTERGGREEYAFAYVRAERIGMGTINAYLAELAWLPMQLDTRTEMMTEDRAAMKRWLKSPRGEEPHANEFGNDFIHALTRCALKHGWETPIFNLLGVRIARLFQELSCLIGVAYYCNWLAENNMDMIALSEPQNLNQTAMEFAALIRSPDLLQQLRAPEQNNGTKEEKSKPSPVRLRPPRQKPELYVIEGSGGFGSDQVPVN